LITATIIDAHQDTAQVFAEYLQIIGVNVVAVGHDGKAAIDIYKKYTPDIVFLDLMMPGDDGIYAFKEIRAMDSDATIIVVTADLSKDIEDALATLKPNEIVFKPFDVDKIKIIVDKLMQKPKITFPEEKKALVSFTITQALLKMSPSATNEVGSRLYAKYRCYFSDCLEHPEYLNDILTDIFGNGARVVTDAIRQSLAEFEDQHPISDFLAVLSK